MEAFADVVRKALVDTFIRLDNDWISVGHMAGELHCCSAACIVGNGAPAGFGLLSRVRCVCVRTRPRCPPSPPRMLALQYECLRISGRWHVAVR